MRQVVRKLVGIVVVNSVAILVVLALVEENRVVVAKLLQEFGRGLFLLKDFY